MGHLIFVVLHIIALLFGAVFLMFTIPAHLVYSAVRKNSQDSSRLLPKTHVRCPDCKEFVLKQANVCKHCGCKLVPQS